ncbi:hypothetical protein HanIR_Chr14g0691251 [Helianthus annuus]|nr:hypothetical protein HanIR_Chr14g0691251 [Helianthus annuus]
MDLGGWGMNLFIYIYIYMYVCIGICERRREERGERPVTIVYGEPGTTERKGGGRCGGPVPGLARP